MRGRRGEDRAKRSELDRTQEVAGSSPASSTLTACRRASPRGLGLPALADRELYAGAVLEVLARFRLLGDHVTLLHGVREGVLDRAGRAVVSLERALCCLQALAFEPG